MFLFSFLPFHTHLTFSVYSDIPKDLCPLYRPGDWEDLSSEKDINPFSKFKSLNKEKRQNGVTGIGTVEKKKMAVATEQKPDTNTTLDNLSKAHMNIDNTITKDTKQKSSDVILDSTAKKTGHSPVEEDFIELVDSLSQQNGNNICKDSEGHTVTLLVEASKTPNSASPKADMNCNGTVEITSETMASDLLARINIGEMTCEKEIDKTKNIELCLSPTEVKTAFPPKCITGSDIPQEKDSTCIQLKSKEKIEEPTMVALNNENIQRQSDQASEESPDSLSPCSPEDNSQKETQMDSESELKLWLLKRIQGPIEGEIFVFMSYLLRLH